VAAALTPRDDSAGEAKPIVVPIVYAVDDDKGMLTSLQWLVGSVKIECRVFTNGRDFLAGFDPDRASCLILDVRMPELSGFDVFQHLIERQIPIPVIFVTANADVPMAVRAMEKGALTFIEKPYNPQVILDLIHAALRTAERRLARKAQESQFSAKLSLLSHREREVLREVVRGKHSKVIAYELGISSKTVDIHRTSIRNKFRTNSVAALVKEVLTHLPDWRL
jgi:FixJ family two-component response regulator